jgi:prophage DNA circulation protein
MSVHYPAHALSNRIYGDGSRGEELIAENKTVHPAFMQRDVIALSS